MLGEVTNQYAGILPGGSAHGTVLALAEEIDMPVAIHIGTGATAEARHFYAITPRGSCVSARKRSRGIIRLEAGPH